MKYLVRVVLAVLFLIPFLTSSEQLAESANQHWQNLGGSADLAPTITSWADNRRDVFVRGPGESMWWIFWNGVNWSNWTNVGGVLTSSPDCTSPVTTVIYCAVKGPDGGMWINRGALTGNGMLWSGWEPQGGLLGGGPTLTHANFSDGHYEVQAFVRGPGEALWAKRFNGQVWGDWFLIPNSVFRGDPDCTWKGVGDFDCVMRLNDDTLIHNEGCCLNTSGPVWENLGGALRASPSISSWGSDNLNIVIKGSNSTLWLNTWNGNNWVGWNNWDPDIQLNTAPDCVSNGPGSIHCVIITADGNVLYDNLLVE